MANKIHFVRFLRLLVYFTIAAVPLFFLRTSMYPELYPKTLLFEGLVEIIFALWLGLIYFHKEYRPRLNLPNFALLIFLSVLIVTSILGFDFSRSFWSVEERMIGVFAFLHFVALYFVLSSLGAEIPSQKLIWISALASGLVSLIAVLQTQIPNLLIAQEAVGSRPGSTFGNPTFMSGYLLFNLFLGLYLFFDAWRADKKNRQNNYVWLIGILDLLILIGVIISETRGTFLGLILGVVFLGIGTAFHYRDKRILTLVGAVGAILLLGGGTFWLTRSSSAWNNVPILGRLEDVSLSSSGLLPRRAALGAAWQGFKEKPVLGWGWENFNIVFNKYYDPRVLGAGGYAETHFDKPHNALAEYFVSGGVLLGASYLFLLAIVFYSLFKFKNRLFAFFGAAAIIGYLIHDFFVFETLGTLLMFFLILGIIAMPRDADASLENKKKKNEPDNLSSWTMGALAPHKYYAGLAACGLIVAYYLSYSPMRAGYYQALGLLSGTSDYTSASIWFNTSLASSFNPYRWEIERDYAGIMSGAFFNNPANVPKTEMQKGIQMMEKVTSEHPYDAYNHQKLIEVYNSVYLLNPELYSRLVEEEAEKALNLSPNRQEIYFLLSKSKTLKGDYKAALDNLKKAVDLDPSVPDAHFYYGVVAFASKNPDLGYKELMTAVKLGKKWRVPQEARVAANYLISSGHLEDAIRIYETASDLFPDDLEIQIKLAKAYFETGKKDEARNVIEKIISQPGLKDSPSFHDLESIIDRLE